MHYCRRLGATLYCPTESQNQRGCNTREKNDAMRREREWAGRGLENGGRGHGGAPPLPLLNWLVLEVQPPSARPCALSQCLGLFLQPAGQTGAGQTGARRWRLGTQLQPQSPSRQACRQQRQVGKWWAQQSLASQAGTAVAGRQPPPPPDHWPVQPRCSQAQQHGSPAGQLSSAGVTSAQSRQVDLKVGASRQ